MMAAASPRCKLSDTPESTSSGPLGDAYCLLTPEISSMGHRRANLLPGSERAFRHLRHAVVRADTLRAAPPQFAAFRGRLPETVDRLGERGRVVRLHQQAAAGLPQDLRERAAARLRHG